MDSSDSAEVKRLFLYYNKILTDDRRSLKSETIEWLLFLKMHSMVSLFKDRRSKDKYTLIRKI